MKNSAHQGGCYPQRPRSEVDNTHRDLQNFTKAEFNNCLFFHSKYFPVLEQVSLFRSLLFCSPKITQSRHQVFLGERLNNLQRAALLTSLVNFRFLYLRTSFNKTITPLALVGYLFIKTSRCYAFCWIVIISMSYKSEWNNF